MSWCPNATISTGRKSSNGDKNMIKPKRIFVVGHMGAGKALLSEALAKKLGWEYIDANPSLERYIGRSLNDIFGLL